MEGRNSDLSKKHQSVNLIVQKMFDGLSHNRLNSADIQDANSKAISNTIIDGQGHPCP